jgi:hypothetical protein
MKRVTRAAVTPLQALRMLMKQSLRRSRARARLTCRDIRDGGGRPLQGARWNRLSVLPQLGGRELRVYIYVKAGRNSLYNKAIESIYC